MNKNVVLEKEALEVVNKSSKPPFIFQLPIKKGRETLEKLQSSYISMYPASIRVENINTYGNGYIKVYIVIPNNCKCIKNVIFYIHGAGWVFGSYHTHQKLVRELAYRTSSVIIFPEYTRSPEVKFPVAIEQCYSILNQIPYILRCNNIVVSNSTLTVAGDSVGGNMATVMALMSKQKNGIKITNQLLFYPVTDDNFSTTSYIDFATDFYLYREGMIWFWEQYEPDANKRKSIFATPLKSSIEELKGLPNTLIINGEADILKDEGISYANKLRLAGNNVTSVIINGMIHDFVMLNSLDKTNGCRIAMDIATCWINRNNIEGVYKLGL